MITKIITLLFLLCCCTQRAMELTVRANSTRHNRFVVTKVFANGRWHPLFFEETHRIDMHDNLVAIVLGWTSFFATTYLIEEWYIEFADGAGDQTAMLFIPTDQLLTCSDHFMEHVPPYDLRHFASGKRYVHVTNDQLAIAQPFHATFRRILVPLAAAQPALPQVLPAPLPLALDGHAPLEISLQNVRHHRIGEPQTGSLLAMPSEPTPELVPYNYYDPDHDQMP